jgi:hypothetical protein
MDQKTETYEQKRERERKQREAKALERKELQKSLPTIEVGKDAWSVSNKTDDRRSKVYNRDVRVGLPLYVRDWETRNRVLETVGRGYLPDDDYPRSLFERIRVGIEEAIADNTWPCEVCVCSDSTGVTSGEPHDAGWDYRVDFYLEATWTAPKPSKIPSKDEVIRALGGLELIGAKLRAGIEAGIAKHRETVEAVNRARVANLVLESFIDQVDEATAEVTRYKQRLAALNAEYKAELEAQCTKLLADLGDEVDVKWEEPDFEPDPRSVTAAKAKLPEAIARLNVPNERGGSRLPSPGGMNFSLIKVSDVE